MTGVIALVQARMGSTRFPGKMLADLGGYPVLEWVLRRTAKARLINKIVLATTDLDRDDPLETLAKELGIDVYRGSESDVLGRFAGAANHFGADIVLRICADNPFIDANEIDRLVNYYFSSSCDYACNHQDRLGSKYADGFGAEILSNSLLQRISKLATHDRHREHVTLYLWDHDVAFNLKALPAPVELAYPELRFDIDELDDIVNLRSMVKKGININSSAKEIISLQI